MKEEKRDRDRERGRRSGKDRYGRGKEVGGGSEKDRSKIGK